MIDDGFCNQDSLTLSPGNVGSSFADQGVHAHRHGSDIIRKPDHFCRMPGIIDRQRQGADDVAEDVSGHKLTMLQHHSHLGADGSHIQLCKVLVVEINRSVVRLFKSEEEAEKCGFSTAGTADDCHELAGLDF